MVVILLNQQQSAELKSNLHLSAQESAILGWK